MAAALTGDILTLYFVGGSGGSSNTNSDPRSEKKNYGKASKSKKKHKNNMVGSGGKSHPKN